MRPPLWNVALSTITTCSGSSTGIKQVSSQVCCVHPILLNRLDDLLTEVVTVGFGHIERSLCRMRDYFPSMPKPPWRLLYLKIPDPQGDGEMGNR